MPSSKPSTSKEKIPCAVCGDESEEAVHFGATACRACAAFFRRTVSASKNYVCRSEGACPIHFKVRCLCKACRFVKCVEAGMRHTAVRKIKVPPEQVQQQHQPSPAVPLIPENLYSPFQSQIPSNDVAVLDPTPILTRMDSMYTQLEGFRKMVHCPEGQNMFVNREPKCIYYQEAHKIHIKDLPLISDWVIGSFPEYAQLPLDQKKVLFHNFFMLFILMECGYSSVFTDRTDIVIQSSGDYVDFLHPENFYGQSNGGKMMSREDAIRIFGPTLDVIRRNIPIPMHRHGVTRPEFLALAAFLLWDHGLIGQSFECEDIALQMRERVTQEIIQYYQSVLRLQDFSLRLSNLLIMLPGFHRAIRRIHEDMELSQVFNVFALDETWCGVIQGRLPDVINQKLATKEERIGMDSTFNTQGSL